MQDVMVGDVAVVIPEGLPAPVSVSVGFWAESEDELRRVVEAFGGIEKFAWSPSSPGLLMRHGRISVSVHLRGDLVAGPAVPMPSAVQRLRDEAAAERLRDEASVDG